MADYREIEEPKELVRLNKVLAARLTKALKIAETRIIGWPAGRFTSKVHFLSSSGDNVFYWSSKVFDEKEIVANLFGHGTPGDSSWLNIDVQFNIPIVNFSRTTGGAFLQEIQTGNIMLAHRGIVTLGHGRVKKSSLFSEMFATLCEADTSAGTRDFLLISELDSPSLVKDIESFSSELRRTVKALGDKKQRRQSKFSKTLKDYFDEFSGKRIVKGRRKGIAECYHGSVVRALRDALKGKVIYKSHGIDLVAQKGRKAFLFEVKTSINSQSIYTAIGQLAVFAPVVSKTIGCKSLKRVIVLPYKPSKHLRDILVYNLGITILTYTRSARGSITINGINQLR